MPRRLPPPLPEPTRDTSSGGRIFEIYGQCFRARADQASTRRGCRRSASTRSSYPLPAVRAGLGRTATCGSTTLLEIHTRLGLDVDAVTANDPFFGRSGRMLAANQLDEALKIEIVTPIASPDLATAITSANLHLDHFGRNFGITTADGEVAHTACVGFGVERVCTRGCSDLTGSTYRSGHRRRFAAKPSDCGDPHLPLGPERRRPHRDEIDGATPSAPQVRAVHLGPSMSARPIWFGPEERPLFGWLHEPEDEQRAGWRRLLSGTRHRGDLCLSRIQGLLADSLERSGYLVLRFDCSDGTGRLPPATEEDEESGRGLASASIHSAIAFVRSSGCETVGLVGLRLGATLAAAAADADSDIETLVLWDPCVKGSGGFLREQQALKNLHLGGTLPPKPGEGDPESVEVLGSVYSRELADKLGTLDIATSSGKLATSVLVLLHPIRSPDTQAAHRPSRYGERVEWREAEG